MGIRHLEQIDTQTGEKVEGVLVYTPIKRQMGFGNGRWFAMAQDALKAIRKAGLTGRDYDVLFALLERLDFENWININQSDLSDDVGMQKSHFNRSIKRLIEIGCILEGPSVGRNKTFRLNPHYGWKGSANTHKKAINERAKQLGLTLLNGSKKEEQQELNL